MAYVNGRDQTNKCRLKHSGLTAEEMPRRLIDTAHLRRKCLLICRDFSNALQGSLFHEGAVQTLHYAIFCVLCCLKVVHDEMNIIRPKIQTIEAGFHQELGLLLVAKSG